MTGTSNGKNASSQTPAAVQTLMADRSQDFDCSSTWLWQPLSSDNGALVRALAPSLALLVPLGKLRQLAIIVPLHPHQPIISITTRCTKNMQMKIY